MKRLLLLSLLSISILAGCKKKEEKKSFPLPLQISIKNQDTSTLISMEIDDQNAKRVFTMVDRGPLTDGTVYATQDVNSGDVLKVHYSTKSTTASADFTYTWNGQVVGVSGGQIGGAVGTNLTVKIP